MNTPTESESHLGVLCKKAFLGFWAYPSPYFHDGKRAKEFCDLLVIFGEDIIVFSDKHCDFSKGEVRRSWSRWYKRAVLSSSRQVNGALRSVQLKRPLFTNSTCTERIHLNLPDCPRIHRVLTVRGARDAARSEWGSEGSLMVTGRALEECAESPFRLGCVDAKGEFFHVIDEHGLDALLMTLDTAPDLLRYLRQRESFLRASTLTVAHSEEDIVALYISSYDDDENDYKLPAPDTVGHSVDSSHWPKWFRSSARVAREELNRPSYFWDEMIEEFTEHLLAGTLEHAPETSPSEQEPVYRWFASERRFGRRILSENMLEMIATTPPLKMRRRHLPPQVQGRPHWVLLLLDPHPHLDYEKYREIRRQTLGKVALVVRYLFRDSTEVVGIATGRGFEGSNFDAVFLDATTWNQDMEKEAKRLHEELGWFSSGLQDRGTVYEIPE